MLSRLALAALITTSAFAPAAASGAEASAWLMAHQQADGAFVGSVEIATPDQATAEALTAFVQNGITLPGAAAARAHLQAEPNPDTELLARRVLLALQAGASPTVAIDALLATRNADGGFGSSVGFQSDALDTAFAVYALGLAAQSQRAETSAALAYLSSQQAADGSFALRDNAASVYVTALATRAFFEHRRAYPSAALAAANGRAWLLTRVGGTLEDFELAQALLAVLPGLTDTGVVDGAVATLAAHRAADGSWGGDAYTTALAMQALALAAFEESNPDLGRFEGRVLDGDYATPLGNATVSISGPTSTVVMTDASGSFVATRLAAGNYTITYTAAAHDGAAQSVTLAIGQRIDLGDVRLLASAGSTPGTLTGVITDATTHATLAGAIVTAADRSATTDSAGRYRIDGLSTGSTLVSVARGGYQSATAVLVMPATGAVAYNAALSSLSGTQFALSGAVTDATTSMPIAGATIAVNGTTVATSGMDGLYAATLARTSTVQITVNAAGYQTVSVSVDGGVVNSVSFSPRLARIGEPPVDDGTGGVIGRIVDGSTGQPVGGFQVELAQGATTFNATVQADGSFAFGGLAAGVPSELRIAVVGYRTRVVAFETIAATADVGTLAIQPDGFQQPATLQGVVQDAFEHTPLAGATVSFTVGGTPVTVVTDGAGAFSLATLGPATGELEVSVSGYFGVSYELTIDAGLTSLGQVRLRPQGVAEVHPDLTAFIDDAAGRTTDPATGVVSGGVALELRDLSFTPVEQDFEVVAFHDADADGVRGGSEAELGRATVTGGLTNAAPRTVTVPLAGMLPFRDAPVSFAIDAPNAVLELREDNNLTSTARACEITPAIGGFSPKLVRTYHPNASLSTPVVGPLMDTDADGLVTSADDPFVLFITHTSAVDNAPGTLRAYNARTGVQAWFVDSVGTGNGRIHAGSTVALADLEGDGVPEVITHNMPGGTGNFGALMVVNNDGSTRLISAPIPYASFRSYGPPSVADLDGDGTAEILYARSVYNANGTVRWHGSITTKIGYDLSAVGDLDMDGEPEVVVGPTAYRKDGTVLWHNTTIPDGKVALANFDDDPNPEVVITGRSVNFNNGTGVVYLLDHDGTKIWGPVTVSPRYTGAPTVGDVDGDGEPEIGIVGNTKYWILEGDGSIKWSATILETSENTSSTFFDFDGNGTVEVVNLDQNTLRVWDGASGNVVFQVANTSSTTYEYPVVVDVDNDGHADLLVPSNFGLRLYRDLNNSWVRTRGIWNQYQYQVEMVADDATVPQGVPDYWLTDNTYRVQSVPEPTAVPDLSVSFLRVVDHGIGQPMSLTVRVGNGGRAEVRSGTTLSFYQGNPTAGGVLLGTLTLPALAGGAYQDLELTGVTTLTGAQPVYAVADSEARVPECSESNNSMSTAVTPSAGVISVATDAAEYGPNAPVAILATVSNTGSFAKAFRVTLVIEDTAGNEVHRFPVEDLGVIAPSSSAFPQTGWNTGGTLAGPYVLRASLESAEGTVLATAAAGFSIRYDGTDGTAAASLRVTTDRVEYHTSDRVGIDTLARNLTVNLPITGAVVDLVVTRPDSSTVSAGQVGVGTLVPAGLRSGNASFALADAPQGDWLVTGTLRDGDGVVLASAVHPFRVVEALDQELTGTVTVGASSIAIGDPQLCTESVTYLGSQATQTVRLRRTLVALATGAAAQQSEFEVELERSVPRIEVRTLATDTLAEGAYACALEAEVGTSWVALDHAVFTLTPRQIDVEIDVSATISGHGRLLVLLDPIDAPDAVDPFGPAAAAPLAVQRAHLDAVLAEAGWSTTFITDAAAFETELASDQYVAVVVLSETVKLAESLQDELVARVHRGLGLLVAGAHDARNGRLEGALGVHALGKSLDATGLVIGGAAPFGSAGNAGFGATLAPNAIRLDGATVVANYALTAPKPKQGAEAAVTANAYGQGRAVHAGFDWLAASAAQGDSGPLVTLLLEALDWIEPAPLPTDTGRAVPVLVRLVNLGQPVVGRVRIDLPAGVTVVDANGGSVVADDLVHGFDLDADEVFEWTFWMRLPTTPGPVTVPVVVEVGGDPDYSVYATEQLGITVGAQP